MDARQFDGLAKALSSGADRRRVLGVLAGGLAATLGVQRVTVAAKCKKVGQKVKKKKECCSGVVEGDRCAAVSTTTCPAGADSCNPVSNQACTMAPGDPDSGCVCVQDVNNTTRCAFSIFGADAERGIPACGVCQTDADCEAAWGSSRNVFCPLDPECTLFCIKGGGVGFDTCCNGTGNLCAVECSNPPPAD